MSSSIGSSIASFGASYIPDLADAANIQTALKSLYFGSTGAADNNNGIYGALRTLYVGNPTLAGNVTITGDLTVNGDTVTINTATLNVEDKEIVLGNVTSPSNSTANGGGIRLEAGAGVDKTITWDSTNSNWTTSEHWNIASGKTLKINNVTLLDTNAPKSMATLMGYTSTATAAGTTTLTNTSSYYQQFTGSTTQTVVLPVTSTLITGWTFHIVNNSTGNVTVNSSGGNQVIVVVPGTTAMVTCIGTTLTTAADWESGLTDFGTYTGTGSVVLGTSPTLTTPTITSIVNSGTLTVPTGGGTLATTSSVTSSILQSLEPIYFGDGSDGDVTITTTTSLTRDMFYNNLTISGATGIIATNGYRVFVAGTLDVTAAVASAFSHNTSTGVASPGGNASGATAGVAGASSTNGPISASAGAAGGTGPVNTPIAGSSGGSQANTTAVFPYGIYSGAVGGAGTSSTGSAGSGGTQTLPTLTFGARRAWIDWTPLAAGKLLAAAGGAGGGSGGGNSSGTAGGGGGGGAGCYGLTIYANTINRGAGTAASFINMIGGAGGNGAAGSSAGHGGGGGGGQGGFVYIVYGQLTGTSKAAAIKTTGGTGGNAGGTATGGAGGSSGAVLLVNLGSGTISYSAPVTGTTPGGGTPTGGTAGTLSVAL